MKMPGTHGKPLSQEDHVSTPPIEIIRGMSIIIADDQEMQRRRLVKLYESLGLNVIGVAKNGLEAVKMVSKTPPDFISMDVLMPVMHGIEAMDCIKEKDEAIPIIMVTAYPDLETLSQLKSPKGFAPDALIAKGDRKEAYLQVLIALTDNSPSLPQLEDGDLDGEISELPDMGDEAEEGQDHVS